MNKLRILCIGEAMVELRAQEGGFVRSVSGDSYNTAVYLKRLLGERAQVDYFTALGDDPLSLDMMEMFRTEGLGVPHVYVLPDGVPGLYAIHTDPAGERTFTYWRSNSAARKMMQFAAQVPFASYDLIYFSGISLAILPADDRDRLLDALAASEACLAYDSNHRPQLWESAKRAQTYNLEAFSMAAYVLSGLDDYSALAGQADPKKAVRHISNLASGEWVLKAGEEGAWLKGDLHVPANPVAKVIDTTAAGDGFNAAYLAHRLTGISMIEAAAQAARFASAIIQHPGAIVPASITQPFVIGA